MSEVGRKEGCQDAALAVGDSWLFCSTIQASLCTELQKAFRAAEGSHRWCSLVSPGCFLWHPYRSLWSNSADYASVSFLCVHFPQCLGSFLWNTGFSYTFFFLVNNCIICIASENMCMYLYHHELIFCLWIEAWIKMRAHLCEDSFSVSCQAEEK